MSKKIHIKSLQSTLKENSSKAKKYTRELAFLVLIFALSILFVNLFYSQHTWIFYIISIGLLGITLYYFKMITNCWQTNKKIKQKIKQLTQQ